MTFKVVVASRESVAITRKRYIFTRVLAAGGLFLKAGARYNILVLAFPHINMHLYA